ncbi:MAG: DUF1360 domain-containing protein [Terracidiphilus sp.]
MNEWLRVVLGALATWRVTHLIAYEDGPWDVIASLRKTAGSGVLGKLMDCFYCLSLWVAAAVAVAIATSVKEGLLLWLGLSGAACLLDRVRHEPVFVERLPEDRGEEDVLLRTEQTDSGGSDPSGDGSSGRTG